MTLLVDPPELAQYAKRGDPHIDQWPGQPVNRLAIKVALYRLAARGLRCIWPRPNRR